MRKKTRFTLEAGREMQGQETNVDVDEQRGTATREPVQCAHAYSLSTFYESSQKRY